jgi:hypothetical protein
VCTVQLSHHDSISNQSNLSYQAVAVLFGGGGVQQIQLRTEDRENGDLGGGSPLVRGSGGQL